MKRAPFFEVQERPSRVSFRRLERFGASLNLHKKKKKKKEQEQATNTNLDH
jgi:hypothetical protein